MPTDRETLTSNLCISSLKFNSLSTIIPKYLKLCTDLIIPVLQLILKSTCGEFSFELMIIKFDVDEFRVSLLASV